MQEFLSSVWADVRENWQIYALMPVFGAFIGYVTKLLAIRMMFQPLEFRGIRPWFGWHGVIPRRAGRMASVACDMLLEQLIDPAEVLGRIDPSRLAAELERPLTDAIDDITREVASEYAPGLWESMPERLRSMLVRRIQAEAPEMIAEVMAEVRREPTAFVDVKMMVVTNLVRDKELLNRIFRESGDKEFTFIARSGIYFGFAIGCVQMVALALTRRIREVLPPLTMTWLITGPWRSTSSVMASWPEVSVMVPLTPVSNWMISAPAWLLASRIACRSEPAPLSPVLITVNGESTPRSSSCSSRGRDRRRIE